MKEWSVAREFWWQAIAMFDAAPAADGLLDENIASDVLLWVPLLIAAASHWAIKIIAESSYLRNYKISYLFILQYLTYRYSRLHFGTLAIEKENNARN